MRRNNTLAAAITATLALTACAGSYADQFENATKSLPVFDPAAPNTAVKLYPDPEFDFVGPCYIPAANATGGIPFASELFGGGTLSVPTEPCYMAAVYTIDGTVDKDFEMTFTLDKGRFAAALIGIRSSQQTAGSTVTSLSTGACTMSAGDLLTASDQVFKFDSASDTGYPYQVLSVGGGYVTFWQLGNKGSCPATGVVSGTSKLFLSTDPAPSSGLRKVVNASTGVTISAATTPVMQDITTGNATLALVGTGVASKLTTGWRYYCGPAATGDSAFGQLVPIFEVKGTTTVSGSDGLLVSVLPITTAGTGGNSFGGFATAAYVCDSMANNTIYLVNARGNTVLSVADATKFTAGKTYKFDGGGTGSVAPNSNAHTTAYRVTATDTTKNTITIEPALAVGALLHGEYGYDTGAFNTGGAWNTTNAIAATVVGKAVTDAVNNSSFSVLLRASTSGLTLYNNDQIMLLYRLTDLGALAASGEAVKMKVDLKVPLIGVVVNPTRELTVARSVQAVNAVISPTPPTVFISVSSNMTQFKGTGISFDNSYVARIGKLAITDASKATGDIPVKEDGITNFEIDSTKVLADSSKLTITNGQFSASTKLPGKVYIRAGSSEITADEVTQDTSGVWSATWNLNSGELKTIIASESYIQIRSDGNTQVNSNTEDTIPHALLELKFNKTEYRQDITAEGDLLRIPRDGIVCTVYNVPPPTEGKYGADVVNIRITNDSNVSDKIKGTLLDEDGNVLYDGPLFGEEELKAGATKRLTNDDLAILAGKGWEGRAVLHLLSNLPEMEVLALIRQQKVPGAPLSNLSVGAKGTSCDNQ